MRGRFAQSSQMKNVAHALLLMKQLPPSIYPFCMSAFSHRQTGRTACGSEPPAWSSIQCKVILVRVSVPPDCYHRPCFSSPPCSSAPNDFAGFLALQLSLLHFLLVIYVSVHLITIVYPIEFAFITRTTILTQQKLSLFLTGILQISLWHKAL